MLLGDIADRLGESSDIRSFMQELCDAHGFKHAAIWMVDAKGRTIDTASNYSRSWVAHYIENGFFLKDPVGRVARRGLFPVHWDQLVSLPGYDTVFSDAVEFGVSRHGVTIPVRGVMGDVALLSLSGGIEEKRWREVIGEKIGSLQTSAALAHEIFAGNPYPEIMNTACQLSTREKDVLLWAQSGLGQDEIAGKIGVSVRMVSLLASSAQIKLKSHSLEQATARALVLDLITP